MTAGVRCRSPDGHRGLRRCARESGRLNARGEHLGICRSPAGAAAVRQRHLELLDGRPVPCRRLSVPTREGETFVVAGGPEDAPPVVVPHGSGSNAARWRGEIAGWARHRRGDAVDVIGEPGLSAPSRPPRGTEAYAPWRDDVLRALSLSRVAMVGESPGGWPALDHAARRPERVTRLAVPNPGGVGRQRIGALLKAMPLRPLGRRRTLLSMLGPAARDGVLDTAPGRFALLLSGQFRYRRQRFPVFDDATLRRLTMPAILGGRDALLDSGRPRGGARTRCRPRGCGGCPVPGTCCRTGPTRSSTS